MKCPHCDYEHGWSGEILELICGERGDFYRLPIAAVRYSPGYSNDCHESVELFSCPSCRKTFIGNTI